MQWGVCWQELGFRVQLQSVAEKDARCREIIAANFQVPHVFTDLMEQCDLNCACSLHNNPADCVRTASIAACGTVCAPYSTQRVKRFASGSVKNHADDALTSDGLVKWLAQLSPEAGVCENVMGWDKPFDETTSQTPLQMSFDCM